MSFFDAFSPEGMLKALGVNPQELLTEYARWKSEFDGMKAGVQQASSHFNTRLNTLEQNQLIMNEKIDLMMRLVLQLHLAAFPNQDQEQSNGHDKHGSASIGHG